jgi:hypothetical protein
MQWNAIILPFSPQLWLAVIFVLALLAVCLASAHRLNRHYGNADDEDFRFSRAAFIVYAAVCQQGT